MASKAEAALEIFQKQVGNEAIYVVAKFVGSGT